MTDQSDKIREFWFSKGRGATEEQLDALESLAGHRLPALLRELLRNCNGGTTNYARYDQNGTYCYVEELLGVGESETAHVMNNAIPRAKEDGVPEGVLMIASGGDAWVGLDYRRHEEPTVVYFDPYSEELVDVARDFKSFFEGLEADED